jgi:meso-butanediol dehydrogenase/(S,S)-butanediol dehydrogenase/diacetyl reductase
MNLLNGKVALITGGGTGIGLEIAKRFSSEGASSMICGRRQEPLQQAVDGMSSTGFPAGFFLADLTREQDIKELVRFTADRYGRIDILVNCAGVMRYGKLDEMEKRDWDLQMSINTYAPWRLSKEVIPWMSGKAGGSIINISSIAGNKAYPNAGVYCTSKAALQMLSQVMAMELADRRIRVNLICPGMVEDTELVDPMIKREDIPAFYARVRPLHPMGRSGKPGDIASAALFFASEESSWITGAILPVDGGRHMATNRPAVIN